MTWELEKTRGKNQVLERRKKEGRHKEVIVEKFRKKVRKKDFQEG